MVPRRPRRGDTRRGRLAPNRGGNLQTRENVDGRDVGERVRLTREAIALEVSRLDDLRRARLGLRDLRSAGCRWSRARGVRAEELLAAIARLEEAWRAFLARNEVRWSDQLRRDGESQVEARRRQRATEGEGWRGLRSSPSHFARERAAAAHASPVTPATGTRATKSHRDLRGSRVRAVFAHPALEGVEGRCWSIERA